MGEVKVKCAHMCTTGTKGLRSIDLHDLTNVPMIKTMVTAMAVKTFRSFENTQCFKDLMLNSIRSDSNTILDQLLAAIQAYIANA